VLNWLFAEKRAAKHFEEGTRLARAGRLQAAIERLRRAVELKPDHADAQFNLGSACRDLGDLHGALAAYRRAAELRPQSADPLLAAGAVLNELRRPQEALEPLTRALALNRSLAEAHHELGNAHTALGNWREALEHLRSALALDPQRAEARWAAAMAQIPAIYASAAEPEERRRAFAADLAALEQWSATAPAGAHRAVAVHQPFYLAYQEVANRELLERYGRVCTQLMGAWQQRSGLTIGPRTAQAPKKVGIVSAHIHDHSVWNALVRGWVDELDPERYELHLFHLGAGHDAETRRAASHAAEFHQGRRPFEAWARAILDSELDVLIYPEIGMDATTAKLAAMRLAPAQATSWGHPETSGLPTIDYFLSAAGLEPPGAQANYSEKLVMLPNLGCYLRRPERRIAAELPAGLSGPVLVCPGTPFKYAPEHDRVLVEIARRVPDARLVFFTGSPASLSQKLKQRLQHAGLDFERQALLLPWLSADKFRALLAGADVYLDTIGFSGFNTALQAVESGVPVVTREGRFLRGRLASGILRHIGASELIAADEDAYVELAVSLAKRRKKIEANRDRLYEDAAPVKALEEFLSRC
jgi:predicted O-linked N-acetylglucosamine transferase (SPINDLY family)